MEDRRNKILNLAEPLVKAQGLEIWGLELGGPSRNIVRLYVDVPLTRLLEAALNQNDEEAMQLSASIDQCEEISRQLGLALEVEDYFPGPWTLEVSTPGLERKFYRPEQLAPYIGDLLEIRLQEALPDGPADRKAYKGKLLSGNEQAFTIEPQQMTADGDFISEGLAELVIPWELVRHVSRIHLFNAPGRPGKKKGSKK